MGFSSLQPYMDTQDNWLQGGTSTANQQERRMESSPPLGVGDILTCSTTLSAEKKLTRPAQNDQPLKCPRCDSTHTKFCYYNNYSLSQPRYFCKACRRYWTKGGSLRNIPVGGGCRKNKRDVSLKKSSQQEQSSHDGTTDLRLSYPHQLQFSLGNNGDLGINGFMESKYNSLFENHRQFDFLENKFGRDFMGNNTDLGHATTGHCDPTSSFHDHFSQYAGMPFTGHLMNTSQRLMLPFDGYEESNAIEVKPNKQLPSLDWQDQESFVGYNNYNGMGSWNGLD